MPANLENSAVATGLEKVSFHSNPKERQCQRMLKLLHIALISHASKIMLKILRKFQKNTYFCFIDYAKAFNCVDHNKLWEILQDMGIPDHLTCLLSNLSAGQEATVRTGHGTTDWFQIRKGVCQGCI